MTYLNLEQGSIVVADVLYSAQIGVKRRPVLIISNTVFNKHADDIIVLKITSTNKKTKFDVSLTNKNLTKGKLKKDSFIMVDFPATIQKNLIVEEKGKLSKQKLSEVKQKIKELYQIK